MTLFNKAAVALAAISLTAAPVAASAAQSVDGTRAVATTGDESQLDGNSSWLIGLAGLIAGVVVLILVADDNDDDLPASP